MTHCLYIYEKLQDWTTNKDADSKAWRAELDVTRTKTRVKPVKHLTFPDTASTSIAAWRIWVARWTFGTNPNQPRTPSRCLRRPSIFPSDNHLDRVPPIALVVIAVGLRSSTSFEPGGRIVHHCGWSLDRGCLCLSAFIRIQDPSEPTAAITRQ